VKIIECKNFFDLLDILGQIKKSGGTQPNDKNNINEHTILNPNLLIVDSLTNLFYGLFNKSCSSNNLDISFYYNSIMSGLIYLATNMNMVVVITTNSGSGEACEPVGMYNESWKKFSNVQIVLRELSFHERLTVTESTAEDINGWRVFEAVKCSRPSFELKNNDKKNFCFFKFGQSGFEE